MSNGNNGNGGQKRVGKVKVVMKNGLCSRPRRPEDVDRRYNFGKDYCRGIDGYVSALGGDLSPMQYFLVKRVAWADLILTHFELSIMGGMEPLECERKWYIGLRNSASRDLGRLGLDRKPQNITPLKERLAVLAAKSAKGGDNGQG